LAPTNTVAQNLRADEFADVDGACRTIPTQERPRRLECAHRPDCRRGGVLDSRVTGELLGEARRAGAKVILAGDDRQFASIEAAVCSAN
jgi:hypothetical protein